MPLHAALPSWMVFFLIMMFGGSMMRMIFGGRASWGRRDRLERGGSTRREIANLEQALADRDLVLEDLQRRLSEMESRLDFTERLLTEKAS